MATMEVPDSSNAEVTASAYEQLRDPLLSEEELSGSMGEKQQTVRLIKP